MSVRALARVNLAAIERNVTRLRRELDGGTELCAVVKADGYGHGVWSSPDTLSGSFPDVDSRRNSAMSIR